MVIPGGYNYCKNDIRGVVRRSPGLRLKSARAALLSVSLCEIFPIDFSFILTAFDCFTFTMPSNSLGRGFKLLRIVSKRRKVEYCAEELYDRKRLCATWFHPMSTNFCYTLYKCIYFLLQLLEKCPDIRWHFIGHLQRNKVSKILGKWFSAKITHHIIPNC